MTTHGTLALPFQREAYLELVHDEDIVHRDLVLALIELHHCKDLSSKRVHVGLHRRQRCEGTFSTFGPKKQKEAQHVRKPASGFTRETARGLDIAAAADDDTCASVANVRCATVASAPRLEREEEAGA